VYEARHVQLSHACAVKVLHAEVSGDVPAVQRAFADARAAAAIGHPGIVDVFDTGQTADGAPYIVTELLEGGSLAVRLGGLRRLPSSEAVELVAQALAALGSAHRRDLVHGNLKPSNLYVVETPGERPTLKLLDFGVRRLVSVANRDGFPAFGTPQFWSPEQVAGRTDIDHRSDL
jgi:serine/threonine-protein kinase